MKKAICVSLLCTGLLLGFTGCGKKSETEANNAASKQCDGVPQLMATSGNHKVYSYCLDNFSYEINGEKVDLRDYMDNNENAVENIINTLEFKEGWDDGGSKLYSGNGISLVECFPLSQDKSGNVYISPEELEPYFCVQH